MKDERLTKTSNKQIFIEKDKPITLQELNNKLNVLYDAIKTGDDDKAKKALKQVVPTYVNGDQVNGGGRKNSWFKESEN